VIAVVVTALARQDARAHHILKEMATNRMLARLEHFHGFRGFTNTELELLRRELQQLAGVVSDVVEERR
jgi:hypothetical protein